jgi:hypothetical protein
MAGVMASSTFCEAWRVASFGLAASHSDLSAASCSNPSAVTAPPSPPAKACCVAAGWAAKRERQSALASPPRRPTARQADSTASGMWNGSCGHS